MPRQPEHQLYTPSSPSPSHTHTHLRRQRLIIYQATILTSFLLYFSVCLQAYDLFPSSILSSSTAQCFFFPSRYFPNGTQNKQTLNLITPRALNLCHDLLCSASTLDTTVFSNGFHVICTWTSRRGHLQSRYISGHTGLYISIPRIDNASHTVSQSWCKDPM